MTNIVYLLGAGRSGTTLMATVLNSHPKIQTIGEMHQFIEHVNNEKRCSCGLKLTECEVWKPVVEEILKKNLDLNQIQEELEVKESHKNILGLLFLKRRDTSYLNTQHIVFDEIEKNFKKTWFLDSSKYIARYLLLKRSRKINVKGIYVVRDVRGVINSFGKQVQTPKSPVSTIVYYSLINFFGQLVSIMDRDVLKIRYEDFVTMPDQTTNKIYRHIFGVNFEESDSEILPKSFEMPHIIGGNRMKTNKTVVINKDEKWKENISGIMQIIYYILSVPLMLINKYKV